MGSVPNILSGAKKALEKAKEFTRSVEGSNESMFAEKPPKAAAPGTPPRSQYAHVRAARREEPGEFMGVRSDQAPELNAAVAARGQYKEALRAAGQE